MKWRSPRSHCTIDQLGRDLYAVLEAVVPAGPVVLVGHSMGGMTVLALADQRPDLFAPVADGGRGIPEADRGRAVERFVRLEQSRSQPGSGLGLSLASAVARLHGGELKLEDNQPGLRSVLSLPRRGPALALAAEAPAAPKPQH